ncbi:Hypothetical protein R9X50_00766200 [Acrodontium crateriforme]|uniref:Protein with SprT-like domain at the N terminus n=1 Tax=Acrodontium crateriforme TaxID=150365 RepID=A0AAQ3MA18_9PEZI|nr:Hypothetical protein R9X50_00766200 [Acrodontium crateriforme]
MPLTDEDAALLAIATLDPLSDAQVNANNTIKTIIASSDPFIGINELFSLYDVLYFRSLLSSRVEVSWSARLTLCAGICELIRDPSNGNKFTRIRLKLSEALLKYRPRTDVINTLLHESIHAYFFITTSWKHSRGDDGTGHGAGFLLLADAINNHGSYEITVFHTFHDEVESYRTHIWQCDGPCRSQAPFFGLVKRSMNRAPAKGDSWWIKHENECGGKFKKISEPDLTKFQVEKLSGLKRAGLQTNKIDLWVAGNKRQADVDDEQEEKSSRSTKRQNNTNPAIQTVICPICNRRVKADEINEHLDADCKCE